MSILPTGIGASGVNVGDIGNSLRFRSVASAYLSRTITTDATSTYFAVVKRGKLGVISPLFDANVKFNANDTLTAFGLTTTAVFRDPTSWLFIHISNNGLYVNGVSYGAVTTSALTNPRIGFDGTNYFDGYIARLGCVAGSSSAYTNFGYFNTEINEWVSKSQSAVKAVVDAGGANSFMLDFDDATSLTTLGYDKSSKGNNWTLNNFSLTAGTTYDHMLDVPGNSYCTLNPLVRAAGVTTLSAANLNLACNFSATYPRVYSDRVVSSGKWYWEVTMSSGAPTQLIVGVAGSHREPFASGSGGYYADEWMYIGGSGQKYNNNSSVAYGATFASGDVIGVALDMDAGTIEFYKNNTTQGQAYTGISGDIRALISSPSGTSHSCSINFGQRPFAYTPPTGFKALCQRNLPDISPATLLDPTDHHVEILVTKSGDTNFTIPWNADTYDTFFEIKRRDAAGDWYQIDGLRGYTKILKSNSTAAETTDANVLGISGTTGTLKSTLANGTYLVCATKAGLAASRQTNTDGSITSTVSRNVDSGFAIVTATGTAANATVGHGLGVALKQIVAKARASVTEWPVYHGSLAATEYVVLNTTAAKATGATYWNSTAPTSSVFSLGSSTNTNNTGGMVFYCYADSAIQKSFSYTGNGSADGPYVNLGLKAGKVRLKCSSTTGNWQDYDSARNTSNVVGSVVYPNLNNLEASGTFFDIDALGIKLRLTTDPNSAQTFIGHAWAAVTGKYSNAR